MIALISALFLLPHPLTTTVAVIDSLPDAPSARLLTEPPVPAQSPAQASSPATMPNPSLPPPQWNKVESLHPGDAIAVLETGPSYPMPCHFDDSTDDTLICIVYPPNSAPRRIVYPLHNIQAVYTEEWTYGSSSSKPIFIGAAIGGLLGGAICNQGSAGAIATCVALGAGIGIGAALAPSPIPLPPRPHLRRHLIYHAP